MVIGSGTTVVGLCCTPKTMSLKSRSIGSGASTSRMSSNPIAVPVNEPHSTLPQAVATVAWIALSKFRSAPPV